MDQNQHAALAGRLAPRPARTGRPTPSGQLRPGRGPRRPPSGAAPGRLAHPLRVQLFDELSVHGSATASMLARKLGESSGATSYHLRQLERHGFVEEDGERGSGRERWWKSVEGGVTLRGHELLDSPATREAASLVLSEWHRGRMNRLQHWQSTYMSWPKEWIDATTESTSHLRLTRDELATLRDELSEVLLTWADRVRGRKDAGLVDVEIQLNAFPVSNPEDLPDGGD